MASEFVKHTQMVRGLRCTLNQTGGWLTRYVHGGRAARFSRSSSPPLKLPIGSRSGDMLSRLL
eukprot:178107-Pyramimonas_sp.AAC.1